MAKTPKSTTGATITDWIPFIPTGTWTSNTTYTGFYRRVGDVMEGTIKVATSGAPTSASLAVSIPLGATVNTSVMADTTNGYPPVGTLVVNDSSATGYLGVVAYDSSANELRCLVPNTTANNMALVTQIAPITFGASDSVSIEFKLPIAEWAGSGITLDTGTNSVEYAATSGLWDSHSSTTIYGPQGAQMNGTIGGQRNKTVTFQSAIQPTDTIEVQLSPDGIVWTPIIGSVTSEGRAVGCMYTNAGAFVGCGWDKASANSIIVYFGQYSNIENDDTGPDNWGTDYWRVVRHRAGVPVGFGVATADQNGLVKKNRIQVKEQTATYLTSGTGAITFSNLVIGRVYKISLSVNRALRTANGGYASIYPVHDGVDLMNGYGVGLSDAGAITESAEVVSEITGHRIFAATATTLSVDYAVSNGQIVVCRATLEELNNYDITAAFT